MSLDIVRRFEVHASRPAELDTVKRILDKPTRRSGVVGTVRKLTNPPLLLVRLEGSAALIASLKSREMRQAVAEANPFERVDGPSASLGPALPAVQEPAGDVVDGRGGRDDEKKRDGSHWAYVVAAAPVRGRQNVARITTPVERTATLIAWAMVS